MLLLLLLLQLLMGGGKPTTLALVLSFALSLTFMLPGLGTRAYCMLFPLGTKAGAPSGFPNLDAKLLLIGASMGEVGTTHCASDMSIL